jgi:serine/threonine protein kinase
MASQTISHYRIVSKLGAGGMGEVYLAEDTKLDRKVAIKFLPPESTADEQAKKRLVREAKAAASSIIPTSVPSTKSEKRTVAASS